MNPNQNSLNLDDIDFNDHHNFCTLLTGFSRQESPPAPSMGAPDSSIASLERAIFDYEAAQEISSLNPVGATSAIPNTTQTSLLCAESTSANDPIATTLTIPEDLLPNNTTTSNEGVFLNPGSRNSETSHLAFANDQLSIPISSPHELLSDLLPLDTVYGIDRSPSLSATTLPRTTVPTASGSQEPSLVHSVAFSSDLERNIPDYIDQTTVYSSAQATMQQDLVDESNSLREFVDTGYSQMYPRIGASSVLYPHQQQPQQFSFQHLRHLHHQYPQYPQYQHSQHQYPPLQYARPQFPHYQLPPLEFSQLQNSYSNCLHPCCNSQYQPQSWISHPSLEASLPYSYPPSMQAHPTVINGSRPYPQDNLLHHEAPSGRQPRRSRGEFQDTAPTRRLSSRKRSVSESRKPILLKVKNFLQSSARLGVDRKLDQQGSRSHSSSLTPVYASPVYASSAPNLSSYPTNTPSSSALSLAAPNLETLPLNSKRITDIAHFRSRNAFFIFRGFVSRLQTEAAAANPGLNRSQAQTKVSMNCGKLWGLPCIDSCRPMEVDCVNCRTRSLFLESASNLKHRQEVVQLQLKFPPSSSSSSSSWPYSTAEHGHGEGGAEGEAISMRRISSVSIEDAFDWGEFRELYPHTDLFRWYRERSLTGDTELDLQEMRRIWIENETNYEKAFIEGAKKRIAQEMARKHAK